MLEAREIVWGRPVNEPRWRVLAAEVLSYHGFGTSGLVLVGAGEQSVCYGTHEVVVVLQSRMTDVGELVGHAITSQGWRTTARAYRLITRPGSFRARAAAGRSG
jgi:hypothetical protein